MTRHMLSRRALIALGSAASAFSLLPHRASAQELTVEAVLNDPDAPVLGNVAGDVTIVEYFDYQCPFCKAMHPVLTDVVRQDGNVRLVLKDWPIFGAPSVYAAQRALGAVALGKYEQVTEALMATQGRLNERQIDDALSTVLPPADALTAYRADRAKWDALLQRNDRQAVALGFQGTPAFAVNTTLFAGAVDREALIAAIATARAG